MEGRSSCNIVINNQLVWVEEGYPSSRNRNTNLLNVVVKGIQVGKNVIQIDRIRSQKVTKLIKTE